MVDECKLMRQYLKSINMMTDQQLKEYDIQDFKFQQYYDPLVTTSSGAGILSMSQKLDFQNLLQRKNHMSLPGNRLLERRDSNDGYSTYEEEEDDDDEDSREYDMDNEGRSGGSTSNDSHSTHQNTPLGSESSM
jgi:hypothetical protein